MEKGFTIKETKNCRKYTKHVYSLSQVIDESFVESFSIFGKPDVTYFSKTLPNCHDMVKIRNYDFSFEIAGSIDGRDLIITYEKKNKEIISMVEDELKAWLFS